MFSRETIFQGGNIHRVPLLRKLVGIIGGKSEGGKIGYAIPLLDKKHLFSPAAPPTKSPEKWRPKTAHIFSGAGDVPIAASRFLRAESGVVSTPQFSEMMDGLTNREWAYGSYLRGELPLSGGCLTSLAKDAIRGASVFLGCGRKLPV